MGNIQSNGEIRQSPLTVQNHQLKLKATGESTLQYNYQKRNVYK